MSDILRGTTVAHSALVCARIGRRAAGPGGHLVLFPGVELGLRCDWGLTGDAANFYSDAGFAVRY